MKSILACALLALALVVAKSNLATAGTVELVNDTWDYICTVEITKGINAPNTSISRRSGVGRGLVTTATDKLCYRRSSDPRNCDSSLSVWTCDSKLTSGTKTFSLR